MVAVFAVLRGADGTWAGAEGTGLGVGAGAALRIGSGWREIGSSFVLFHTAVFLLNSDYILERQTQQAQGQSSIGPKKRKFQHAAGNFYLGSTIVDALPWNKSAAAR